MVKKKERGEKIMNKKCKQRNKKFLAILCSVSIFLSMAFVVMIAYIETVKAGTPVVLGDLNGDEAVTTTDAGELIKYLLGDSSGTVTEAATADVNNDEFTDLRDLVRYKRYLTTASASLSGAGTEADPYIISSLADLYNFIEQSKTGNLKYNYYKITNDITVNIGDQAEWDASKELIREWTPIGYKDDGTGTYIRFYGTLLGDGHTISGIYLNNDNIINIKNVFGYSEGNSQVKDLNLTNSYMNYNAPQRLSIPGEITNSTIRITPTSYVEGGDPLLRAENTCGNSSEIFQSVIVNQIGDGTHWRMNPSTTKLISSDAAITTGSETVYYDTLSEAMTAAGNDTTSTNVEIVLLQDLTIDSKVTIARSITLKNLPGKIVTVSRGASMTDHMFYNNMADVVFELKAEQVENTGGLIIDGASTEAISGVTVLNENVDSEFILGANVTIQNASTTKGGAALNNSGKATLYGNMINNTSLKEGGAITNSSSGVIQIKSGTYSGNTSDTRAGFMYITGNANSPVYIEGGSFTNNSAPRGGAFAVGSTSNTYISNASFTGNQATGTAAGGGVLDLAGNAILNGVTMTGNSTASTTRGGGAILMSGAGKVTITNCDISDNAALASYPECDIWLTGNGREIVELKDTSFTGIVGWMGAKGNTIDKKLVRYSKDLTMANNTRYQMNYTEGNLTVLPTDAPDYSDSTMQMNIYAHRSTSEGTFTGVDGSGNLVEVAYPSYISKERFQEFKDCGFNVLYIQENEYQGQLLSSHPLGTYLELANEVGLKCIISDKRIKELSAVEGGLIGADKEYATMDELVNTLKEYVEPYISHPAFFGLTTKDEPRYVTLESTGQIIQALKQVGEYYGVDIYVKATLMPYNTSATHEMYTGEAGGTSERTFASYETYVQSFLDMSKSGVLCYDDYPFRQDEFLSSYLQVLQHNVTKAAENDAVVELVVQSFGKDNRRMPDLQDLYLQNNLALGFGVKNIGYFTYWRASSSEGETITGGILNYDGTKMLYDEVQEVNAYTQDMAKVILNFDYVKANFSCASGATAPTYFSGVTGLVNSTLDNVTATVTEPTIITQMQDSTNNRTGYMVVNADSSHVENIAKDTVTLTFTNAKYVTKYSASGTEIVKLNSGQITLSLAEGEGAFLIPHN